jgi:hypothetical protein
MVKQENTALKLKKQRRTQKIELVRTKVLGTYYCDRCNAVVVLKKQLQKNCRYYHCYHCGDTRFYYGKTLGCFCHTNKSEEFIETRNGWFTYYCPEHNTRIFSKKEWVERDLYKTDPLTASLKTITTIAKTLKEDKNE